MGILNENGIAKLAALASASYARIYHTHDYVKEITEGTTNGTIDYLVGFDTYHVPIKGLKSAAYTESTAYAAYSHTHNPNDIRLVEYVIAAEVSAINTSDTVTSALGKLEAAVNSKSAIGHTHSTSNITALTNYSKPNATSALSAADTLNEALGKLEKALDGKQNTGNYLANDGVAIDSYMLGGIDADDYALKTDIPVIPGDISYFNNDVGYITSVSWNDVTNKPTDFASTEHTHSSDEIDVLTDYIKPLTTSAIAATDSLNDALGKLEAALDTKQDTGNYLTPSSTLDATNLSGTIPAECYNDTVYIHPSTPGNKHIPSGGEEGQILRWAADGMAAWGNDYNTQYTASDGITLNNGNFINSGVRSIATGATNGTISVNTGGTSAEVSVYGLGSAAYTDSTDYLGVNATAADSDKLGNVVAADYALKSDIPTDISSFTNDTGYITGVSWNDVTNKPADFTPSSHTQASNTITALTDYAKAVSISAIETTDTLNEALGKLEKALDGKQETGAYLTAASTLNAAKLFGTIPAECYTDTIYIHPTTPGNKHIPEGGSDGQILVYSSDGEAAWTTPDYFVTTNTTQDITGEKTFVGAKRIKFKQSANDDKLGFTLYSRTNVEKGYLEFNPQNLVDGVPIMTLGNYASAAAGLTHVGFRKYSSVANASGAYNLLTPLISDAREPFSLTTTYTNFYFPLGVTNGSSTVVTDKRGVLNISSLLPTNISDFTNDVGYITTNSGTAVNSDKLGNVDAADYATKNYVDTAIANLVDSAPGTLDTLSELATALGNDPNFATTITGQIGSKVSADSANYIKSASVSGSTLTLTKGDDTTVTFSDTTYPEGTVALLEAGADLNLSVFSPKTISDYVQEVANAASSGGHTHSYLPLSGGTVTGRIMKAGVSCAWNKGRDGALVALTSINGYSPTTTTKTLNGSWEIGAYNYALYQDQLTFTYITDTDYNGTNKITSQIRFAPENGGIIFGELGTAKIQYNASTGCLEIIT